MVVSISECAVDGLLSLDQGNVNCVSNLDASVGLTIGVGAQLRVVSDGST